ncbi:FAD-dependent oxidoreductase [Pseudenhygromyxa sp. WMMC2535]|uniref:NAD(P)/FAD-dependent oxidoreductase n=1 Tax=Pseudenhygromyxa sp. WMMC2535 TaxID=2712867 RepID=UPI001553B2F7|nr:FAD-dependent oxidoreductase [Pseudenhygromyxa sp. WMMC2535]NVB39384.1 FAD-dependent oxidoreductase [Pseudenhygromyxa sp. WMMC2535]
MRDHDAHVLILGGSFTGVELVRTLREHRRGRALEIIVVDRQAEHPYIPLGHELLTERMATGVAAKTVLPTARYVGGRPKTRWERGEIVGFEPEAHAVTLADGRRFSGRFVVVALGSEVGAPAAIEGAEALQSYKFAADFERAKLAVSEALTGAEQAPTALVVGGGITGVEIAGELAHLARASTRPGPWRAPKVVLVHGGERLLPGLHPRAGAWAARALEKQGVELHMRTRLQEIVARGEGEGGAKLARLRDAAGEVRELAFELGFWAGGLQPPPVLARMGLPLTEDGWLRVGPSLQCYPGVDEPEIFAGGDVARIYGGEGRWPTMQRAIEGIFAAHTIADNLLRLAGCDPGYAAGVPPLHPHRLWSDFPHGVSAGGESLVVHGGLSLPLSRINTWFRRFLMHMYMRRYSP